MTTAAPTTQATQPDHRQRQQSHQQQDEAWEAHAVALAHKRRLPACAAHWLTAHAMETMADLHPIERWSVPSARRPGRVYVVTYNREAFTLRCQCPAGSFGHPCAHAGAVCLFLDDLAWQLSEEGRRSHLRYLDFCEWLETRGY